MNDSFFVDSVNENLYNWQNTFIYNKYPKRKNPQKQNVHVMYIVKTIEH